MGSIHATEWPTILFACRHVGMHTETRFQLVGYEHSRGPEGRLAFLRSSHVSKIGLNPCTQAVR